MTFREVIFELTEFQQGHIEKGGVMSTVFIILLVILLIFVGIILLVNIGIRFAIFTARTVIDIIKSPASLFFIMCFIVLAILALLINQKSTRDSSYDHDNDIPVATEYKRSLPENKRTHFNTSETNTPTRETQEEPIHIEEAPKHKPIMDLIKEVPNTGVVYDAQGNEYKTVKIGSQLWMAENLNYKTQDSYCYQDDETNCSKYGRLYAWNAAKMACPSGWHLPSKTEWETLFNTVSEPSTAATKLRSPSRWKNCGNCTDSFGFSALPVGVREKDGSYRDEGIVVIFWSSTEDDSNGAYYMYLSSGYNRAGLLSCAKLYWFSVRCLKNSQ